MGIFKTELFKNIDKEVFVGRFAGEDITIEAEESIMLAPYIVRHIARQLADKMLLRKADEYLANCSTDKQRSQEPSYKDEHAQAKLIAQMRAITPEKVLKEFEWERQGMTPEMKEKMDAQRMKSMPVDSEQVNSMIAEAMLANVPAMKPAEEFAGLSKLKK